jgi:hypothetical protein
LGSRYSDWRRWSWRSLAQSLALVGLLAGALGGCAAQSGPSLGAAASPTPTNDIISVDATNTPADPTLSLPPTPTFVVIPDTSGPYGPACHAKQLTLRFAIDAASSGTSTQMGTVTNQSTAACSLFGFPDAQLLDAQRAPMTLPMLKATSGVWSGVFPEQRIQLAPGASAYFATAWSQSPTDAQMSCLMSSYFALTPQGDSSAVTSTDVIRVCGAITISPFQIAPFMGS